MAAHNQVEQAPQLYDIYGLWHVPFWQKSWFIALASIVLVVLCAAVFYYVIKTYRSKKYAQRTRSCRSNRL